LPLLGAARPALAAPIGGHRMTYFLALNDNLPGRVECAATIEAAQAIAWPEGRPNIIVAGDGRAWVLGAFPDQPAQWFETTTRLLRYQALRHGQGDKRLATLDLAARNFEVAATTGMPKVID